MPGSSTLLTIKVRDTNPSLAAAIANELSNQLIAASPAIRGREAALQESIDKDLADTQDQIEATQARIQTLAAIENRTSAQSAELLALDARLVTLRSTFASLLPLASGSASNVLTVVEPADTPTQSVAPTTLLNTLLAAALGLLAVAGFAFLKEQLDDSIKDADGVREVTSLGNLGTIPQMRGERGRSEIYRMVTLLYPRSITAEAYRALRVNLEFASVDRPVQVLLVTSGAPGEGKSVTAANLAAVFAQAGRRVMLVDADLRWPGVHKFFDAPNVHGITTLLRGETTDVDAVSQATEQTNLRILTTGPLPPNPAELLGSQRMQAILGLLRQKADHRHPRQPAAPGGRGRRCAECLRRRDVAGHQRRQQQAAPGSVGARGADAGRSEHAWRRPQPSRDHGFVPLRWSLRRIQRTVDEQSTRAGAIGGSIRQHGRRVGTQVSLDVRQPDRGPSTP